MPDVKKCPPAKAYGYDRSTLNDHDKMLHDLAINDDYSRALNAKHNAASGIIQSAWDRRNEEDLDRQWKEIFDDKEGNR